jgi:alanine racemase
MVILKMVLFTSKAVPMSNSTFSSASKEKILSWIEISSARFHNNVEFISSLLKTPPLAKNPTMLSAVIKANGYGHGDLLMAELIKRAGISWICVHSLPEAERLRRAGAKEKILLLGPFPLAEASSIIQHQLRPAIFNLEQLEALSQALLSQTKIQANTQTPKGDHHPSPYPVHLKIETGTNRQGLSLEELTQILPFFKQHSHICLEGLYSHFANVEDTTDHTYAQTQINRFNQAVELVEKELRAPPLIRHLSSTAATLVLPSGHFDLVRPGIGIYGHWPSRETFLSFQHQHPGNTSELQPILSWKARLTQIKNLSADESIGYGLTFKTSRPSKIGIIPIGYSDGLDRKLSNQSYMLVRGKRAYLRGRIAMNLCAIDLTDIPNPVLGEEVVVIGESGGEKITADDHAKLIGTINYEVLARINPLLPRFIV